MAVDERIKEIERWKKAESKLKEFESMMELVKKYPIKLIKLAQSSEYTIPEYR